MHKIDTKKPRAKKTIREQYILYLNELECNPDFRENTFNPKEDPEKLEKAWKTLAAKINCTGGPIKTVKQWRHVFADWKCLTRKKERENQKHYKETGNKDTPIKFLTDLEERLLDLTGRIVVEGLNVPELGTTDPKVVEIITLEPKENKSSEAKSIKSLPCQAEAGPSVPPPKKRKHNSLSGSIQDLLAARKEQHASPAQITLEKTLQSIDGHLEDLIRIEQKKLDLKWLNFRLKYPTVTVTEEEEQGDKDSGEDREVQESEKQ